VRLDYQKVYPTGYHALLALDGEARKSTLESELLELVRLRASQINGCVFCLDMHAKDARALGESQQRLDVLAAWREAPLYSARERAALAWCEALTLVADTGAPDETYEQLMAWFTPEEAVALTMAIVAINGWNRLAVGFQSPLPAADPSGNVG
jgi:AhpD family alkylhydroperoxidase